MEIKYKKERLLLLGKIYEQKNFILTDKDKNISREEIGMKEEDFNDMIGILVQRGLIKIEQKITREGNLCTDRREGYQNIEITFGVGDLILTKDGLIYIENNIED